MESTSEIYNELLQLLDEKILVLDEKEFKKKMKKKELNEKETAKKEFAEKKLSKLSLEFYLTRHTKQEKLYESIKYDLSEDLKLWLLNHIISEVSFTNDEDRDKISVTNYNDEFTINDSVGELDLTEPVYSDINNLNMSILNSLNEEKKNESILKSNFQCINISNEDDSCLVCFYRGIKKSGKKRKYLGIISGNISENTEAFFDVGGNLSFILYRERVFIFRVKEFEYAFKYTSHITKKRDENIEKIIELGLFSDDTSSDNFRENSSNYLYARGIAGMDKTQIDELTSNYDNRCVELKEIKQKLDNNPDIEDELRASNGILVDLLEFIDFENDNKIKIDAKQNITPVLHFIQDKIVESFLTKKVKTIIGYQKG